MGYNLIPFSEQSVFRLVVYAHDHCRTSPVLLYSLGYGTSVLLCPHKFGKKKEEQHCCHCNQPNHNVRFLNYVTFYPSIFLAYTSQEWIYKSGNGQMEYKFCLLLLLCTSAIVHNLMEKQSQQSVMSCHFSKVTLEIGGRYFRCLL